MKCGFHEIDITPRMGSIIPGDFKARYSRSVRDPLYLRALAADDGERALAILSIDACGITADLAERIRVRVEAEAGIPREGVMVMATHCHGGGPTLNWGEEVVSDPEYLDMLVDRGTEAIVTAYRRAAESEVRLGRSELHGYAFIRVYRMKDGTLKTNPACGALDLVDAPTTEIDPEVLALGVWQNGMPVGALVNFATHPATVANDEISGDYISELCRTMKAAYGQGFVTVFVNGACGNVNRRNPFDPETLAKGRERVIGRALGERVIEALASAAPMQADTLAAEAGSITVGLRKPSDKQLLEAKALLESLGDGLEACKPGMPDYPPVFFAIEALRAMADKRTRRTLPLQLLRIGDALVAGTPCQLFVQFGKRIKAEIGAPCFVSAFANDYAGYVPTPDCFGEAGVYEAKLCPTSVLEPTAGDAVVDGILALAHKMNA
ncbi:MAG: hypothetical protein J6T24_06770 [Clostridia bacterium]|nr:hypothetical protein [Clostridia bacterium]